MISPFYCKYTICKSTKLDGYHNTADLINFLNQIPQLTQTIQHHFANHPEFPHFISLTLLSTNYQSNTNYESTSAENYSYDYSEEEMNAGIDLNSDNHQTNLIVVLVAKANNGPRYVEPILEKISEYLNWELMYEEDKEETDNNILKDLFHSDKSDDADDADDFDFENDNDNDQDDTDEDEDDFDIHITKNIPGYSPFHRTRRSDSGNFLNNNDNNTNNNSEEDENKDDDQEDDFPNNDLSRFK